MLNKSGLTILYYPSFDNDEQFTDHYYRMLWYLNPLQDRIKRIIMPYEGKAPSVGPLPYYLDPAIKQMADGSEVARAVDLVNCRVLTPVMAFARSSEECGLVFAFESNTPGQ